MLQNKVDEIAGRIPSEGAHERQTLLDLDLNLSVPAAALAIDTDLSSIWAETLASLKSQLDPQIYAAWLAPLQFIHAEHASSDDGMHSALVVDISAPNKFCCDHVRRTYGELIVSSLRKLTGAHLVEVHYKAVELKSKAAKGIVNGVGSVAEAAASITTALINNVAEAKATKSAAPTEEAAKRSVRKPAFDICNLNSKYNFSNFVIGQCNQFAHAAALRVAENPGCSYNPLFVYGGVGLGKTHLVNAIGNASRRRGKNVLLVSSEVFVNELISALRSNRMQQFKEKFRTLDLLIIDDIQFIIGKERTQEEFFHTFNALYQRRSQIIITSDKLPQELTGLEERLRTRFASGLSADLQAPDFETRVAILQKKCEIESITLPDEVARFLAEKIDSNVRELEGALTRLNAVSAIHNQPITLELAEGALRTIVPEKTREVTIELIQKTVAERFNTTIKDLLGKRRTQNIALPRQVAMHLCRKLTTCSYPEIGALFGGRDHSTVIHANRVIEERLQADPQLTENVEFLEKRLRGR